jgi:acid phosphatase type 7
MLQEQDSRDRYATLPQPMRGQMDHNLKCRIGGKNRGMLMIGSVLFLILGIATSAGSESKIAPKVSQKQTSGATRAAEETKPGKPEPKTYVLVGAGDIAGCSSLAGAAATAKLIEQIPGTVFVAGDLAYDRGTAEEFSKCYDSTWGKFKDRTRPAPGNHEYGSPGALAYFAYWGERAGPRGKGYYSYDLGKWHVVALNTNCNAPGVGGCGAGSEQEKWLKKDLEQHANSCIVAYGHYALFSSGFLRMHAVHPELRDLWRDLYAAHADLMLAGHEHSYERFAPQDPDGHHDPENGIRELVVGTGGRSHYPMGQAAPNSEQRNADTFGVLKLTLSLEKYSWEFIPVDAEDGFHDSGEGTCHNAAAGTAK